MATEKRLIDANYFANKGIRNCPIEEGGIPLGDFAKHQKILELYPTVDAVEVVHGRWIAERITNGTGACPYFNGRVGDNRHNCVGAPFSCPCKESSIWGKSTYHCSECGLEVGYSEKAKTNYCPNCGAKMDL